MDCDIEVMRVGFPNLLIIEGCRRFSISNEGWDVPQAAIQCVGYSKTNAPTDDELGETEFYIDGVKTPYREWIGTVATAEGYVSYEAEIERNSYGGVKSVRATVETFTAPSPAA